MVAEQRDPAELARACDHVHRVRAGADHVAERPQLVDAVGGGEHRLQRLGVRVGVGKNCYSHPE